MFSDLYSYSVVTLHSIQSLQFGRIIPSNYFHETKSSACSTYAPPPAPDSSGGGGGNVAKEEVESVCGGE